MGMTMATLYLLDLGLVFKNKQQVAGSHFYENTRIILLLLMENLHPQV